MCPTPCTYGTLHPCCQLCKKNTYSCTETAQRLDGKTSRGTGNNCKTVSVNTAVMFLKLLLTLFLLVYRSIKLNDQSKVISLYVI